MHQVYSPEYLCYPKDGCFSPWLAAQTQGEASLHRNTGSLILGPPDWRPGRRMAFTCQPCTACSSCVCFLTVVPMKKPGCPSRRQRSAGDHSIQVQTLRKSITPKAHVGWRLDVNDKLFLLQRWWNKPSQTRLDSIKCRFIDRLLSGRWVCWPEEWRSGKSPWEGRARGGEQEERERVYVQREKERKWEGERGRKKTLNLILFCFFFEHDYNEL